jgi:hypothetical protein
MKSVPRPAKSGVGLLVVGNEAEDFAALMEEKGPDDAHAKAQSRREGTQRIRHFSLNTTDRCVRPTRQRGKRGRTTKGTRSKKPRPDRRNTQYPSDEPFILRDLRALCGSNPLLGSDAALHARGGAGRGASGLRSRCSRSSRWIYGLTRMRPFRVWNSPAGSILRSGFAALN